MAISQQELEYLSLVASKYETEYDTIYTHKYTNETMPVSKKKAVKKRPAKKKKPARKLKVALSPIEQAEQLVLKKFRKWESTRDPSHSPLYELLDEWLQRARSSTPPVYQESLDLMTALVQQIAMQNALINSLQHELHDLRKHLDQLSDDGYL